MPVNATVLNPDNVLVGTANGPGIWIAPVGTPKPATISTAPATPWNTLGYLSDDGVKISQSTDSENITAWQSKAPLRSFITKRELMLEFTMLELSKRNFELYFGQKIDDQADPNAFSVEVRADAPAYQYAVLLDLIDGDVLSRMYFPRSSLNQAGDMEVTQSGAIGLPVTLAAQDSSGLLMTLDKGPVPSPTQAKQ